MPDERFPSDLRRAVATAVPGGGFVDAVAAPPPDGMALTSPVLPGASPGSDTLDGLFARFGFRP